MAISGRCPDTVNVNLGAVQGFKVFYSGTCR